MTSGLLAEAGIRDFARSSRRWGAVTGCAIIEIDLPRNPGVALRRVFTVPMGGWSCTSVTRHAPPDGRGI